VQAAGSLFLPETGAWRYVKKNQDLHGLRRGVGTSLGRDIEKATAGYKGIFQWQDLNRMFVKRRENESIMQTSF
jgi:hypothetical protein